MCSVWYTQPVACQFMNAGENTSYFILKNIKKWTTKNYKQQTDWCLCQHEILELKYIMAIEKEECYILLQT